MSCYLSRFRVHNMHDERVGYCLHNVTGRSCGKDNRASEDERFLSFADLRKRYPGKSSRYEYMSGFQDPSVLASLFCIPSSIFPCHLYSHV